MRTSLVFALLFMAVGARAQTQTIVINPRPPAAPVAARAQRVTINVTIANSVPVASASDLTSGFMAANQGLYSVVDHECDVLAPLLHGDCRLVGMTTNGNANERPNFNGGGNPTISVSANATFEIEPKPAPPAPK